MLQTYNPESSGFGKFTYLLGFSQLGFCILPPFYGSPAYVVLNIFIPSIFIKLVLSLLSQFFFPLA